MPHQALEAARNLRVPFAPVVADGFGAELEVEAATLEQCGNSSVGSEQRLAPSGGEINGWRLSGIGSLAKHEGIGAVACLAAGGAEDGPESPPFTRAFHIESPFAN